MARVLIPYGTTEGQTAARVAFVGGALIYTRYGFIKRSLMKRIARDKRGHLGVDTSRDYVYTEWEGVKRFAVHFAASLIERTAPRSKGRPAGADSQSWLALAACAGAGSMTPDALAARARASWRGQPSTFPGGTFAPARSAIRRLRLGGQGSSPRRAGV